MTRDEMPGSLSADQLQHTACFGHFVEDVRAAVAAGVLEDKDPFLLACGLWAAVHGLTSLLIAKPEFPWPPIDELIAHVLHANAHGIAR